MYWGPASIGLSNSFELTVKSDFVTDYVTALWRAKAMATARTPSPVGATSAATPEKAAIPSMKNLRVIAVMASRTDGNGQLETYPAFNLNLP